MKYISRRYLKIYLLQTARTRCALVGCKAQAGRGAAPDSPLFLQRTARHSVQRVSRGVPKAPATLRMPWTKYCPFLEKKAEFLRIPTICMCVYLNMAI